MTDILDLGAYKPVVDADGDADQLANGFTAIESWGNDIVAELDALDVGTIPDDITLLQSQVATLQSQLAIAGSWVAATGAWTLTSSDSPVFVLTAPGSMATTLYPGSRLKITDTTDKYAIVVKVAGAVVTCVVESSVSIITNPTAVSYSYADSPPGFPKDPTRWEVIVSDGSDRAKASPSGTTWYLFDPALTLNVPIGAWDLYYRAAAETIDSGGQIGMLTSLSTSQTSESDTELTSMIRCAGTPANLLDTVTAKKTIAVTSKTPYYLIARSTGGGTSINFRGSSGHPTVMRARLSYV